MRERRPACLSSCTLEQLSLFEQKKIKRMDRWTTRKKEERKEGREGGKEGREKRER